MAVLPLEKHFRTYPHFLVKKFGFPVYRVSVDTGFTCPNRDGTLGTTGCIYCNNASFSPSYQNRLIPIEIQIAKTIEKHQSLSSKFIVYFQSYSNTYDKVEKLRNLYNAALSFDGCVGLAIGTRSDCVDEEKLDLLEDMAQKTFITVEYGLQSPYAQSLIWMKRGHDYDSFVRAVERTALRNISICVHIILGIPGETRDMMLKTASEISMLPVQFLKIHQLQIIWNTPLALLYEENPFPLWNIDDYSDFICDFLEELREDIVVQRLYSISRPGLLIAPQWGLKRQEIDRVLHERIRTRKVIQGKNRRAEI